MNLDQEDLEKETDPFFHIDGIVKWVRIVFIIILISPFVLYFTAKIDIEKQEKIVEISAESLIENGIDLESGLIVDEGYEVVRGTCGACHSLSLVTQNSATREGWKDVIVWMQKTQKLWDLGESEVVILDYLEKNYAPKEQGRRASLKNIEWYEL
ncbi:MAG: monoheme cytochrome C [Flavobacteriales bacterium]|nr:monoheme cytochrome C [Flavobacteriales bacterium]